VGEAVRGVQEVCLDGGGADGHTMLGSLGAPQEQRCRSMLCRPSEALGSEAAAFQAGQGR
jgi:hypothetical protein